MSEVLFRPDSSPTTRLLEPSPRFTLWRLEGSLDLLALEYAVEELLDAHDDLLLGQSLPQRMEVSVADFVDAPEAANQELSRKLVPPTKSGFRFHLQRLESERHRLLLVLHKDLAGPLVAQELLEELVPLYDRAITDGFEHRAAREPSPTRGGLGGDLPPFRGSLGDRSFTLGDGGDDDFDDMGAVLGGRTKDVQPAPAPASDDALGAASDGAADEASDEGDAQQGFHFRVEGEKVAWRRVQVGSDFELIFDFGEIPAEALARIEGEQIEKALLTNEDGLDLALLSPEFKVRDGQWIKPLRFEEGSLAEPVRFRLRAPEEVPEENPLPLHLVFSRRGSVFYRIRLTLRVVEQIRFEVRPGQFELPPTLDLDAEMRHAVDSETEREAILSLSSLTGDLILASLQIGDRNYQPQVLQLSTAALADHVGRVAAGVTEIASGPLWKYLKDPFEEVEERFLDKLEEAREQLISAGSELFAGLASDSGLGPLLQDLDELPDGSRITILTDRYFIPWELLYPRDFVATWPDAKKAQSPADPRALWGYRFQIETLLFDDADSSRYPVARSKGQPFVTCYINPTINPEAVADHKALEERLEPDHWHWIDEGKAMGNQLFAEDDPASLLYFLCHGGKSAPFDPKSKEVLQLDKKFEIEPRFLNGSPPLARRPLVVLNACDAGAISPLAFTSFLSQFLERQAAGLVVPSFPVPVIFGVAFGHRLLEGYLAGETIGETIYRLRRRLIEVGNPLGLFYTLQCKLEVRAPGPLETRVA